MIKRQMCIRDRALADYGNGGGHPAMAGGFIPKKNMEKLEPDRDLSLIHIYAAEVYVYP